MVIRNNKQCERVHVRVLDYQTRLGICTCPWRRPHVLDTPFQSECLYISGERNIITIIMIIYRRQLFLPIVTHLNDWDFGFETRRELLEDLGQQRLVLQLFPHLHDTNYGSLCGHNVGCRHNNYYYTSITNVSLITNDTLI